MSTHRSFQNLTLALTLVAGILTVPAHCFGYGYQITITELSSSTLTVSDNDPNNKWSTTLTTSSPLDVWSTIGLPATGGVVFPVGTFFTAEPGEPNFVNEVVFLANDGLQVYSDITSSTAGKNTIIGNNGVGGAFPMGQDNKGNLVSLVFDDIPSHNANGQDVPDSTSTASVLLLSLLAMVSVGRGLKRSVA